MSRRPEPGHASPSPAPSATPPPPAPVAPAAAPGASASVGASSEAPRSPKGAPGWSPESWKTKLAAQQAVYTDRGAVEEAVAMLRRLPPLVTSWEIERLRKLIGEAQEGKRFLLQGGDCAEQLADCTPDALTSKLKILLQMSLVLTHASKAPVIRVGRFAGQYAKPRSSPTETRTLDDGRELTLPSYYGDLVNDPAFTHEARRPDPYRMVRGYKHAGLALNFIRSLLEHGFADLHHPEYWNLDFLTKAGLTPDLREQYTRGVTALADALRFLEAIGDARVNELTRVEFFTSHEGLNLLYEAAQTRTVPHNPGFYDLTTHLPWIGERTRDPDGAHVEYFRGIENPVGVKIGASITPEALLTLIERLNPNNTPGKIMLITRFGAGKAERALPALVNAVGGTGRRVLWVCDPMHGNTESLPSGRKTRRFDHILEELEATWDTHRACGSRLGGVHFELTGEDVTECIGGAAQLSEADLERNYASPCDPRLNYEQALELAFHLARRMERDTPGRATGA